MSPGPSPSIIEALLARVFRSLDTNPAAVERAMRVLSAADASTPGPKHARRVAFYGRLLGSGGRLEGHHLHIARRIARAHARSHLLPLAARKAGLLLCAALLALAACGGGGGPPAGGGPEEVVPPDDDAGTGEALRCVRAEDCPAPKFPRCVPCVGGGWACPLPSCVDGACGDSWTRCSK